MNDDVNYTNNPLHGLSLKNLLIELVDHYGFKILFAYLSINCFKTNPSIESSVKFLKKTDWAREKIEAFYLYEFKNLPKASSSQFLLPPRDRIIPNDQMPGEPAELSFEDAERLQEKRAKKAAEWNKGSGHRPDKRFGSQRDERSNDKGSSQKSSSPWKTRESSSSQTSRSSSPNTSSDRSDSKTESPAKGKIDPWAKSKNNSDS